MLGVLRHQCSNYMIRQCYITIQKICYIYQLLNHPRKHERLDNKGVENQQEMNSGVCVSDSKGIENQQEMNRVVYLPWQQHTRLCHCCQRQQLAFVSLWRPIRQHQLRMKTFAPCDTSTSQLIYTCRRLHHNQFTTHCSMRHIIPSVLWRCWLGGRKRVCVCSMWHVYITINLHMHTSTSQLVYNTQLAMCICIGRLSYQHDMNWRRVKQNSKPKYTDLLVTNN